MAEYWNRYWTKRNSRRRFLGGAVGVGAGAAGLALVGCGDDDDDDTGGVGDLATKTPEAKPSGAAASPTVADPFANAKKGGTLNSSSPGNAPSNDPYGNGSFLTKSVSAYVYSRLFKYNAGPGVAVKDLKPVGDLAEGSEPSPDGLTWTIKLRQDAKFHDVAPVSGHAVTTEDIKYSWSRVQDPKSGVSKRVPFIESLSYPDEHTVVFKLNTPYAAFLDALADTNVFYVMPKEADGGFDPATKMIGSGPWQFKSFTPDVSYQFDKNPDWFVKGFPLMDHVNVPIIPDPANQIAQFRAGNLDQVGIPVDDLIDIKNNVDGVELYGVVSQLLSFLYFDSDPASPWFKDDRVRQAISMSLDRDALTDLGYQIKKLQAGGIDVVGQWNNIIPAGNVAFWRDPKDNPNFAYNVAEAMKLLSAAGFPDEEYTYQYTNNAYGATFGSIAEAQIAMLSDIGVRTKTDIQDYSSKYKTQTFDKGNFKGIAFGYETPFPEAGGYSAMFLPGAPNNHSKIDDPKMNDLWAQQAAELDRDARIKIFDEIQKYHGEKMYYIPSQAGAGTGWTGFQPWLQVKGIHTVPGSYGSATETYPYWWKSN